MDIDLAALPDDVDTLQRMVRTLATERVNLTEAQAEIERLRLIVQKLQRSQFGRRAERLDDDQSAARLRRPQRRHRAGRSRASTNGNQGTESASREAMPAGASYPARTCGLISILLSGAAIRLALAACGHCTDYHL
jgi:hypothetical protein